MLAKKIVQNDTAPLNGIDLEALGNVARDIEREPAKGIVEFRVTSQWQRQTCSRAKVEYYSIGGRRVDRIFVIDIDEPLELLGENTAPNPQEMLMAALNACITVGYVVGASAKGIALERLEIETSGQLDLRGFLGIDASVRPGYEKIYYVVRIKGDGTADQFRQIHETVMKTSPNYFNISQPITIDAELRVE
jgi:uncharacterized OsmC-like protein